MRIVRLRVDAIAHDPGIALRRFLGSLRAGAAADEIVYAVSAAV